MGKRIAQTVSLSGEQVPGISIAATGLALSLFAYESSRMSAFQSVETFVFPASLIPQLFSLAAAVTLLLLYRTRPKFRIHRHPLFGFALAALFAITSLLMTGEGSIAVSGAAIIAARSLRSLSVALMLACWMESLLPNKARDVAVLFSLATFVLAGLNLISAFFKSDAAHVMVAIVPFVSMACLYWYKDHALSFDNAVLQASPESAKRSHFNSHFNTDKSLLPRDISPAIMGSLFLMYVLPLICYAFVFGYIHYSWVPAQDGAFVSLSVQLAAAAGTLIAGVVLLVLVSLFWGRKKLELYNFFILSIMALALFVTTMMGGGSSFTYVVPLNIAQKLAFFFIWMSPFLIPNSQSPLVPWCIALATYQLGKILSSCVSGSVDQQSYSLITVGVASVLVLTSTAGIVLSWQASGGEGVRSGSQQERERKEGEPGSARHNDPSTAIYDDTQSEKLPTHTRTQSIEDIARTYQLTRRETEVLELLAEGMTAQSVAETLVVSTSTAKSHMRNIYTKLGIHTQSELILMTRAQ